MAWRWQDPSGRESSSYGTQAEAIASAVRTAAGRGHDNLDAAVRDRLWASLVKAGWRLVEG